MNRKRRERYLKNARYETARKLREWAALEDEMYEIEQGRDKDTRVYRATLLEAAADQIEEVTECKT